MSLRPPPRRLNPNVEKKTANPGNVITQQDDRRYGLPLLIIIPHETAFRSPRPRKVTVAWYNMNQARSMVASTIKGDKAFGMMWRNIIRKSLAPRDFSP